MTPEEIRSITFDKGMRGYRPEDVDDFIENIAKEMETLMAQKAEAEANAKSRKDKMLVLAQKVEEYRSQVDSYRAEEDTLRTALLNAQRMGDNIMRDARQQADGIIREANLKADSILSLSRDELEEQKEELARVKNEVSRFKNEVLGLYKTHIELLTCKTFSELDEEPEAETAEVPEVLEVPEVEIPAEPELQQLPEREPAEEPAEPESFLANVKEFNSYINNLDVSVAEPAEEPQQPTMPAGFDSFRGISFDD